MFSVSSVWLHTVYSPFHVFDFFFQSVSKVLSTETKTDVLLLMSNLTLILISDRHQRLWDVRDDFASERPRPARFPRQLWGHRGRRWAFRLRLEGRAEAGQPTGGDLQGGCRHPHPWANDRPTAHIRQRQSGYNPASWRRRPPKVAPHLCFLIFTWKLSNDTTDKRCLQNICRLPTVFEFCAVVSETEKQVLLKNVWSHNRGEVSFSHFSTQLG